MLSNFLTCIHISQETGKAFHLFKNFPQLVVIHKVKGFNVVNETEVDFFFFFGIPLLFYDPVNAGNLISGSSAFSKPRLYFWKFLIHILLKPSLKDFEHKLTSL